MGNCCPSPSEEQQELTSGGRSGAAFQGEGHRLGTAGETYQNQTTPAQGQVMKDRNTEDDTTPVVDPNVTEDERAKIRADRAAAAEARLKKQGGAPPKKKKVSSDAPLRGPNSQPTMRWNA
uniref:Uncharacterized protein n=1 Tax=Entomoneis paludosa TaxID=265537 RepID=A0A7S2Y7H7_9STRA|mmetsp:Transcript_20803/g.43507  ORF Transcript_20803/g.43507 Transcript_20803/m.43507 type:complete len:121 (+) Transcript_20803:59-421(+)|eukprot:CAMPEP_0172440954 /NCGR_PEP_ID=MMETSP1065-20121228/1561_1 /TAXON_ID=265537 /ORGANISM="Amphiprora paludosa, Strain CCMP125" /LENGTH=120 /DNA_ID=CAMNT_0013190079 /DNA_START=41 /DNA_END=403 /DNA_ORIENTATION=+